MTDKKYVTVEVRMKDENGESTFRWLVEETNLHDIVEYVENTPNVVDCKFTVLVGVSTWG